MKSITMKDIAQELDISVVSVSKALAGKSGVSEQLREQIVKKAQQMGYVYAGIPEVDAAEQGNIGILVADRFFTDSSFYSNMYRSLVLECTAVGISCLLEIITHDNEKDLALPNLLTGQKCSGIIFMGELNPAYVNLIAKTGIPYIMLDFYQDTGDDDSVVSDGLSGSCKLTTYLLEQGHKRIGFVGTVLATSSILDRYLGYYKALLCNDVPLREDWIIPDRDERGRFIDLILPQEMPEAFLCNCDETAYLLINTLRENGYRVPEDVSVVGFDDFRFATLSQPALTTYRVDIESMSKLAVTRLLRKISRTSYTKGCSTIRGEIVLRDSVCKKEEQ